MRRGRQLFVFADRKSKASIGGVLRLEASKGAGENAAPVSPLPYDQPAPLKVPGMALPTVIMVGADKGGVGKTTISRALADWLNYRRIVHVIFDTESPEGDLRRFNGAAKVVDIEDVKAQMAVFDQVEAARVTLIDVRAGLLSPTIKALDAVRLLEDVKAGAVELVLLHVIGSTVASLKEIPVVSSVLTGARYVLVKNYASADVDYFDWEKDPQWGPIMEQLKSRTISTPYLQEAACEKMQRLGLSFASFIGDTTQGRVLRGYTHTWLNAVWAEFDRIGIVDTSDASIRVAE
jgi:hypothetical protein